MTKRYYASYVDRKDGEDLYAVVDSEERAIIGEPKPYHLAKRIWARKPRPV